MGRNLLAFVLSGCRRTDAWSVARAPTTRSGHSKIKASDTAISRAEASCPRGVRPRRGCEPSTAFYTTVTSVRRHSGLSINREPFDFRIAQRREGISTAQRPEALVPSESGHQGTSADSELRMDRDCVRLRDALLPPETHRCAKARRWLAEESAAMVCASRESTRTKKRVRAIVETAKDCLRSYLHSRRDQKQ